MLMDNASGSSASPLATDQHDAFIKHGFHDVNGRPFMLSMASHNLMLQCLECALNIELDNQGQCQGTNVLTTGANHIRVTLADAKQLATGRHPA